MKYYFEDEQRRKELKKVLEEWVGTPFKHKCGVKGLGCDCIHFAAAVFGELGLVKMREKDWPDYPRDWHLHNTRSLLIEGLERHLKVERVGAPTLCGDICVYNFAKTAAHVGIYCDGLIYQAIDEMGVQKISPKLTPFSKRLFCVYRILA